MDLLKAGQKLSILFQKEDSLVEIACVISALLEDRIVIDLPQYFMRYIEYLDVGCSLTIKAFSKIGTVDFNTIVITSPLEDEFSVELDYNFSKLVLLKLRQNILSFIVIMSLSLMILLTVS